MAATVRGEALIGGRKLVLNIGALCDLEARFDGRPVQELFAAPSLTVLRAAIACGLGVTDAEAGALMDQVGLTVASEALGQAVAIAFPEAKGDASPPMAAPATTG